MIVYRHGRPGDGPALSKLFCESFAATFGHLYADGDLAAFLCDKAPEAFEAELADPAFAFRLAADGGVLMGFVKCGPDELPLEAPAGTWELHQLYVDEVAKGTGVAQTLIDWAMDEGRARGFAHLTLSVYVDNHRARRFYERNGFVEVGAWVFMVGSHEDDDRIMRRAL